MRRSRAALPPADRLRRGSGLCICLLLLLLLPQMGVTLLLLLLAQVRVTLLLLLWSRMGATLLLLLLLFQLVATALLLLLAVHLRCCCLGIMASSAKGRGRVSGVSNLTTTQCTPLPSCTAALQRLSSPWPSTSAEQRGCNAHT